MTKVILINIRCASWPVIDSLVSEKKLPTIRNLLHDGYRRILKFTANPESDIDKLFNIYIHTKRIPTLGKHSIVADDFTLVTGATPWQHGLICDTQTDKRGIEKPASDTNLKKRTIWKVLAQKNKSVGVLGWGQNFPSKFGYTVAKIPDLVNLRNLSEFKEDELLLKPSGLKCNFAYPLSLNKELNKINYDRSINQFIKRAYPYLKNGPGLELICDSFYLEWAKYLLKSRAQPDFLTISLNGLHNLSHLFWDCLKIQKSNFKGIIHERRRRKYGHIIEDYYEYLDRELGELLSLAEKTSVVMITSTFDMLPSRILKKLILMDKLYEKLGFLSYKNKGWDLKKTKVYDNLNPWGIYAVRKGFILGKQSEIIFKSFRRKILEITTDKNKPLFKKLDFNKEERSFTVVPDYGAIHRHTKLIIEGKKYPVGDFVIFLPHYSLHGHAGIFILSGAGLKTNIKSSIINIEIFHSILALLKVKYKDEELKGHSIFKAKRESPTY